MGGCGTGRAGGRRASAGWMAAACRFGTAASGRATWPAIAVAALVRLAATRAACTSHQAPVWPGWRPVEGGALLLLRGRCCGGPRLCTVSRPPTGRASTAIESASAHLHYAHSRRRPGPRAHRESLCRAGCVRVTGRVTREERGTKLGQSDRERQRQGRAAAAAAHQLQQTPRSAHCGGRQLAGGPPASACGQAEQASGVDIRPRRGGGGKHPAGHGRRASAAGVAGGLNVIPLRQLRVQLCFQRPALQAAAAAAKPDYRAAALRQLCSSARGGSRAQQLAAGGPKGEPQNASEDGS